MRTTDLPADVADRVLARRRRIQTANAFVEALFATRAAVDTQPCASSGIHSLLTYGTLLVDDGVLWKRANERLPLEVYSFLERLELVWAALQPEERQVLHLLQEHTYREAVAHLVDQGVRTRQGAPVSRSWVHARVKSAHARIEHHPVFTEMR